MHSCTKSVTPSHFLQSFHSKNRETRMKIAYCGRFCGYTHESNNLKKLYGPWTVIIYLRVKTRETIELDGLHYSFLERLLLWTKLKAKSIKMSNGYLIFLTRLFAIMQLSTFINSSLRRTTNQLSQRHAWSLIWFQLPNTGSVCSSKY